MEPQGRRDVAAPTGALISIPSALTGQLLEYFVPDPITSLVRRLQPSDAQPRPWDNASIAAAFPLVGYLVNATSGRHRSGDLVEIHRRLLFADLQLRSQSDLMALGTQLCSRASRFRQQMAFAGGPTPSTAAAIFVPPSAIPDLFAAFVEVLKQDSVADYDPVELAALVGYYMIHVHPFDDGNGRFARILTLHAGVRSGSPWSGAAVGVFLAACRQHLAKAWVLARWNGLSVYLSQARKFCASLWELQTNSCITGMSSSLLEKATAMCGRSMAHRIIYELFVAGRLDVYRARTIASCSQKKALGILQCLVEEDEGYLTYTGQEISAEKLSLCLVNAVTNAAATSIETSS